MKNWRQHPTGMVAFTIVWIGQVVSLLVVGPAMMKGGSLTPVFGWLVGTGPSAGIVFLFVITGMLGH